MRNPLTVALVAMAAQGIVAIACGWSCPSVAMILAGVLAVAGALASPPVLRGAAGGCSALAVLVPSLVPVPLLVAGLAAVVALFVRPPKDPLENLRVAVPALVVVIVAMTL